MLRAGEQQRQYSKTKRPKSMTGKGCTVTKKDAGQKNWKISKVQKRKTEPKKLRRRGRRDRTRK